MDDLCIKKGFTLLEIMVIVIIIAIIATLSVVSYRSFIAARLLQSESYVVMQKINHLRSQAIKKQIRMIAKFNTGGNAKSITFYEDSNNDSSASESEKTGEHIFSSRIQISETVPSNPLNIAVNESWMGTGGLVVEPDMIGTIKNGRVYLKCEGISHGYCIQKYTATIKPKIFKWDGKRWTEL